MTGNIITRTDLTNTLFRELSKIKRITPEEEKIYIGIYKDPNASEDLRTFAKQRIIEGNIRWIVTMAKKYSSADNFHDIFSEAVIGAEKALELYEADKNVLFMTYARHYIQREINNYLNRVEPAVVISNYPLQPKIRKERNLFVQEHMREPSVDEMVDILKEKYSIKVKDTSDLYQVMVLPTTDTKSDDDDYTMEDSDEFNSRTASENAYEDAITHEDHSAAVAEFLATLSEKERKIVSMSFGIGTGTPMSNEEIGAKLGYTAERIRQVLNAAMKKMRKQASVTR